MSYLQRFFGIKQMWKSVSVLYCNCIVSVVSGARYTHPYTHYKQIIHGPKVNHIQKYSICANQAYLEFEAVLRHLFNSESTAALYFQWTEKDAESFSVFLWEIYLKHCSFTLKKTNNFISRIKLSGPFLTMHRRGASATTQTPDVPPGTKAEWV